MTVGKRTAPPVLTANYAAWRRHTNLYKKKLASGGVHGDPNLFKYNTTQYNTINIIQYNTIQHNKYNTIQYNTTQ